VLSCDEATNARDSLTEREVHAAIDGLKGVVTPIVIADRLSTVTACDDILVDHGRIFERGSHKELMAANERYRQTAELQSLGSHTGTEPSESGR
jgi:ABC-type multidrug transport system fused ATPase/permease subunit